MSTNGSGFYQAWKHRVARIGRLLGACGWLLGRLNGKGRLHAFLALTCQACSVGLIAVFLASLVAVLKDLGGGETGQISDFSVTNILGSLDGPLWTAVVIGTVGALGAASFLLSEILALRVSREQHVDLAWRGLRWLAHSQMCEPADVKRLIIASRLGALATRRVVMLPTPLITIAAVTVALAWTDATVLFVALIAGLPCAAVIYFLNLRAARMQRKYLECRHETGQRLRALTAGVDLPESAIEFETPGVSEAMTSLWGRIRVLAEARAVSLAGLVIVLATVFGVFMESTEVTGAAGLLAIIILLRVGLVAFGQLATNLTTFSRYFPEVEWLGQLQRKSHGNEREPSRLVVNWGRGKGLAADEDDDDEDL